MLKRQDNETKEEYEMTQGLEILFGGMFVVWEFVKPAVIGSFYIFCIIGIIKYLILDGITEKIEDAVRHLREIERKMEQVEKHLWDIKYDNNRKLD